MSDSEKPEADYSETDAVVTDEQGQLRVKMESLQKGGASLAAAEESDEE